MIPRFDPARLRSVVGYAVLLAILAGAAAFVFHRIASEPSIDAAIAIEEQNKAAEPHDPAAHEAAPEVSRSTQKGVGLFLAYTLGGAALGVLFALAFHGLRLRRPDEFRRALLVGAWLGGAVVVAPWLKYPPNPPAVGDPGTLSERQALYFGMIAVALAVGFFAMYVAQQARRRGWPEHRRLAVVVTAVVVPMLVALAVMPPAPDAVAVPATLAWRFRLASLGGNLLLWTVLSVGFGWLAAESRRRTGVAQNSMPLSAGTPAS